MACSFARKATTSFYILATTEQHQVVKTTLDGEQLFVLEYPKDAKDVAGKPCYQNDQKYKPTNIAFAPNGDFYVADGYGSNFMSPLQHSWATTFPHLAARERTMASYALRTAFGATRGSPTENPRRRSQQRAVAMV